MSTTPNVHPVPEGRLVAALGFKELKPHIGTYPGPHGEHVPVALVNGAAYKLQPGDPYEIVKTNDAHRFDLPTWKLMARGKRESERQQAARDALRVEVEAELRANLVVSGKSPDTGLSPKHVRPRLEVLADLVADGKARFLGSAEVLKAAGRGRETWPSGWPSWAVTWVLTDRRAGFVPAPRSTPDLVVACSDEVRDGVYPLIGYGGKDRNPVVVVRPPHHDAEAVTLVTGEHCAAGSFDPKRWIAETRTAHEVANGPKPIDPTEAMAARLGNEIAITPEGDGDQAVLEILARSGRARRVEGSYVIVL